jgi:kynurenine formamidase
MIIDLTHTLGPQTHVSKYDNKVQLKQIKFLDKDGYNDSILTTSMHIGTHIDAPSHMLDKETYIDQIPLDAFIGRGVLLDVRKLKTIAFKKEYQTIIQQGDIVIFYTGMEERLSNQKYFSDYPVIEDDMADFLIQKGIKAIALDSFSPDKHPFSIHKKLLSNKILIAENLSNVKALIPHKEFTLHLVPIKTHTEGAFIRAYAII